MMLTTGIRIKKFLLCCFIAILGFYVVSLAKTNKKVKVTYKADKLEGGEKENGQEPYKQLIGHVVFIHEDFTIYADSAQYYDEKGIVKAAGNLKMIDKEGGVMVAERVIYDIDKKLAQLRKSVSYEQDSLSFYTDELDYEVKNKKGYFRKGGILIQDEDEISSESGYYDEKNKLAVFYKQVQLNSKDYDLQTDNLRYHTNTKLSIFKGNTKITTKDGETITTKEGGQYNTDTKEGSFKKARVETDKYSIYANLLKADQNKNYYSAVGRVALFSKEHKTTITGEHAYYDYEKGIAEIYGNPLLEKVIDEDILYMIADTFKAIEDKQDQENELKDHVILAYNNVKIYKTDLQGKADSMAYHSLDSTIYFYDKPVFWNYDSQITGESVNVVLNNEALEKMYINADVFIASQDELGNYNQVKGREMTAYFEGNKMSYIDILGNGESLYFALGDNSELVGMNYIRCSHIRINMKNEALSKINFFVQPTGIFYPAHKIVEGEKRLPNFIWRLAEKPTIEEFISRKHIDLKSTEKKDLIQSGNSPNQSETG
jgi:lipopolysaccharide assembly outer membrane protein LptD (OstA)